MTNPHGTPIWYELLTSDPDAAQAFYSDVVGWKIGQFGCKDGDDAPPPPPGPDGAPMDYRVLTAPDGGGVGGLMKLPEGAPMPPAWLSYIGVDDVDAAVESIKAAGGAVHMPPMNLEGVGRMSMVADPQGAVFYVMRGASDEDSGAMSMAGGHCGWNELSTSDPEAALAFYTGQFNWTKGDAMPMGEMGEYRFINHGEGMIGAVMRLQAPDGHPAWLYYFVVPDIDVAFERIKAGGGKPLYDPMQIPGGSYALAAIDPQGAVFGLSGPRKS